MNKWTIVLLLLFISGCSVGTNPEKAGDDGIPAANAQPLALFSDTTPPEIWGIAPASGYVSGIGGAVPVSVYARDTVSGLDTVTFFYGASCTGPWVSIGNGASAGGDKFVISWNVTALDEGSFCLKATATDLSGNPASLTSGTIYLDKFLPYSIGRQLNKVVWLPNETDQMRATISAQDSGSPVMYLEGRFNYDGSGTYDECVNQPPNPPCRGGFAWSTTQAYLLSKGFDAIIACTGSGAGYAGISTLWGTGFLGLLACQASYSGYNVTTMVTLVANPAYGELDGNWIAASATDTAGNSTALSPLSPALPSFSTSTPVPPVPSATSLGAFTAGTSQTIHWTQASDPYPAFFEAGRTNLAADAVSCGSQPPPGYTTATVDYTTFSYTFTGLTDGQKYCYWVRSKNTYNSYSAWSAPVFSTQDATAPTCTLSDINGTAGLVYYDSSAGKVYYNNQLGNGTISVGVSSSDDVSGVKNVEFPPIPGFTGTGKDATPPYNSADVAAFGFSSSTQYQSGNPPFKCSDNVGNLSTGTFALYRDINLPYNGSLSYPNGEQYTPFVVVAYDPGVDSESGVGSVQIQRKEATYISKVCGSYSQYQNVGTQSPTPGNWTDYDTQISKCYVYRLVTTDRVGNSANFSSASVYKRLSNTNVDKAKSTVTAAPEQIAADGVSTSTITVTPKDPDGKLMGIGQTITITLLSGTGTLIGTVLDAGNGTYTQQIKSPEKTGSGIFGASVNGIVLDTTPTVAYLPGTADKDKTTVEAIPSQITADGISTAKIVVTPYDSKGNKLGSGQDVKVDLVSGSGTIESAVIDKGDGTYEVTVKSPVKTGQGVFGATVNSTGITQQAQLSYVPGTMYSLGFLPEPPTEVVAGETLQSFGIAIQDAQGNVIISDNSTQIVVSLSSGTSTLKGTLLKTVSAGIAVFDDLTYEKAETIKLGAVSVPPSKTLVSGDIVVNPAAVHHVSIFPLKSSVKVGSEAPLQLSLRDKYENRVPEEREIRLEAGGGAIFSSTNLQSHSGLESWELNGTTLPDGTGTVGVTDQSAELIQVAGSVVGIQGDVKVDVQFSAESPDHVVLTAQNGTAHAGESVVLDLAVKDSSDVDLQAMVFVSVAAAGNAVFTASSLDDSKGIGTGAITGIIPFGGKATVTVTDVKSEKKTTTPESTGLPHLLPDVGAEVEFAPAAPAGTIDLTADPQIIRADGKTKSKIAGGPVTDQYGNAEPDGTLIAVTTTCGTISGTDPDGKVATVSGKFEVDLISAASACDAMVDAASAEGSAAGNTPVKFVENAAPVADAGPDQEAVGGDTVTLDGSGSYDPDSVKITFKWSQKSGTSVTLDDPAAMKPKFTAPDVSSQEALQFELTVNDGYGDSEPSYTKVTVVPKSTAVPKIVSSAALKGTTGVAYHYDADDTAEADGRPPMTWSKVRGPEEMLVDPGTGKITWVPVFYGPTEITIGVSNKYGSDSQSFTVEVDKGNPPPAPVAKFTVDKNMGDSPLTVAFDAGGSSAGKGAKLVSYSWDFGDSTFQTGTQVVTHSYPRAGSYNAVLTVLDDYGQTGATFTMISVTRPGHQPPTAKITATPYSGTAPLQVVFGCDCQGTSTLGYYWDFGDGATSLEHAPEHEFKKDGSWPVMLYVTDEYGLSASDKVFITVAAEGYKPPTVRIASSAGIGEAPVVTTLNVTITKGTGTISSQQWSVDGSDSGSGLEITRTFNDPGLHKVSFKAVDDSGSTASDALVITVLKSGMLPPQIISVPPDTAEVGVTYSYLPAAAGDKPFFWSITRGQSTTVEPPPGMTLDVQTGAVSWTPQKDAPANPPVTLSSTNSAGTAYQTWNIAVSGLPPVKTDGGSGKDGGQGETTNGCGCATVDSGDETAAVPTMVLIAAIASAALVICRRKE